MTITATDPRPRERAEKAVGFADRELPFPLPPTFDSVDAEREYEKSNWPMASRSSVGSDSPRV